MKQSLLALTIITCSFAGIVLVNSVYIIDATEQVVITEFGKPIGKSIENPGFHWKVPFVQTVNSFDKRILEWDGYPSEIPTADRKFIWVDVTGRWRIKDPLLYLQTLNNERTAQSRLDDIMDGITRNTITKFNLPEIVRSTNHILDLDLAKTADDIHLAVAVEKIETGRDEITRKILEGATKVVKDYGIELIDLRIKRLKYNDTVQKKVFERMISESKRVAEQLRSEGQGVLAEIYGQKEKDLKKITSEAYKTAQVIKGKADAEATKLYGDAYSKDPDFFAFKETLEHYPDSLRDGKLVLTTDSDFLKYLKKSE